MPPDSTLLLAKANKAGNSHRSFVICDDCFWCASLLGEDVMNPSECAICKKTLYSTPIGRHERYTLSYSEIRGIELEFSLNR
jgi:hypothetical protein